MKILVTGAGGQVGRQFAEWCENRDEVVALDHAALDITDHDAVGAAVDSIRPDVVVHTASWTAVDACESDVRRSHRVNGDGAAFVADAAGRVGAYLIHLSTDYVFDGMKPTPYVESDVPNPLSVYGQSKLAGELAIDLTRAAIIRISWVCGRYGSNMVKTLLRLAADGADPKFVNDQIGHPTIVDDLVPMLHRFAADRRPGLFHVTNQGAVSWFDFAREVFSAAGADPERVTPIATSDLDPPRPAPRPANSVLDNAALRASGIPLLPHHGDSLVRLVRTLQP